MHTVNACKDYILVELSGDLGYDEIWAAIVDELSREDFRLKNDIWSFGETNAQVQFGELDMITRNLAYIYPRDATRTKTALVAAEGLVARREIEYRA